MGKRGSGEIDGEGGSKRGISSMPLGTPEGKSTEKEKDHNSDDRRQRTGPLSHLSQWQEKAQRQPPPK